MVIISDTSCDWALGLIVGGALTCIRNGKCNVSVRNIIDRACFMPSEWVQGDSCFSFTVSFGGDVSVEAAEVYRHHGLWNSCTNSRHNRDQQDRVRRERHPNHGWGLELNTASSGYRTGSGWRRRQLIQ